jgi:hypothetical protein
MVPLPRGSSAVSECSTSTASGATPRVEATNRAKAVSWPWPCGAVPVRTVTRPSGPTATAPYSRSEPEAVVST